jgi:pyruvate dehydrogenase E2 component (dihydrolipoamide acetyltransferase)
MATEITMPKLSDTMEEGTILRWQVKEGDRISRGDVIAEVETDKAAMEMEAFEDGTVGELRVAEGETVAVGTVIAVLNGAGEEQPRPEKSETAEKKEAAAETEEITAPAEERQPQAAPLEEGAAAKKAPAAEAKKGAEKAEQIDTPPPPAQRTSAGLSIDQIVASPAARNLAKEKGLALNRVRGTGPGGRIVTADVERASARGKAAGAPSEKPAQPATAAAGEKSRPERSVKIRRLVARKMVESWQSIPHFFVTVAVDMTDVIRIRKDLGASINDFIISAAARCLLDHPWVNSHWVEGEAAQQERVHIAIAVATARGLYNPVLRDCGRLSLKEIGRRTAELVEKAHAGRLNAEELEGGTFTISNMGMLGVESFSAIITPPQAAVLAVGTVKGEAVVGEKGDPGIAPTVRLTLSADHRILDGADAAEFLTAMKSYLEAPVTLITCDHGKD